MKKAILIFILFINTLVFSDTTIVALDQVHHSFGSSGNNRTTIETVQFPANDIEYSSISMRVDLNCPNGGCDPWDRKAKISVYHLDQWIEIGRYVTPYGIECGWFHEDSREYCCFVIVIVVCCCRRVVVCCCRRVTVRTYRKLQSQGTWAVRTSKVFPCIDMYILSYLVLEYSHVLLYDSYEHRSFPTT